MILSPAQRIVISFLIELGKADGKPVNLTQMQYKTGASISYLEQIARRMKLYGLIYPRKGPRGGYLLNRPLDEISLFDVMSVEKRNPSGRVEFDTICLKRVEKSLVSRAKEIPITELGCA